MLLACLSHAKEHLGSGSFWYHWLAYPTRLATPTFLLLSGFIIGHLVRADTRGNVRLILLDRGLFLLIPIHLLFGLWDLPQVGLLQWMFGRGYITDVFGIALLAAVPLRAASTFTLASLGTALCLGSWVAAATLHERSEWVHRLGVLLFDVRVAGELGTSAPLVPYLGVFLIGMALSLHVRPMLLANAHRDLARRLAFLGGAAIFIVFGGIAVWHFGHEYLPRVLRAQAVVESLRTTFDPRSKRPPSPAYVLFYGGAALLVLSAFLRYQSQRLLNPIIRTSSIIGRASLMCFVVQDWLLLLMPEVFGFSRIHSAAFWFTYLAACLAILYRFAKWWDDRNGNRFLTIGLRALVRRPRTDQ